MKLKCPHCRHDLPEVAAPMYLLRRAIKKAGSQKQLTRNIGMSQAIISKWMLAERIPHIRQLQLLDYLNDKE